LLVLCVVPAAAGEAPGAKGPGGFRDLLWGMSFAEAHSVYPDLEVLWKAKDSVGETWQCRRAKEDRVSGPVTFDSIEYQFFDGRFDRVVAMVRNAHGASDPPARKAFDHYLKAVTERFGEPSARAEVLDRTTDGEAYALWKSEDARVLVHWKANEGNGREDVFRLEVRRPVPR